MYTEDELQFLAKSQSGFKWEYKLHKLLHALISLLATIIIAVASTYAIFNFVLDVNRIHGNGMEPAMPEGKFAVSNRLAYLLFEPGRGDIVVAGDHVYRIIGLPGDTIDFYGGHVLINGKTAVEKYQKETSLTYPAATSGHVSVPEGSYYVLCDNRSCYDDSRLGLMLDGQTIQSKILFIF